MTRDSHSLFIARTFYCGVLGGRQVWPEEHRAQGRSLWFLVEQTLIEVRPEASATGSIELPVDAPNVMAERCWNAGYTVTLPSGDDDGALAVVDPFGRAIILVAKSPEARLTVASES